MSSRKFLHFAIIGIQVAFFLACSGVSQSPPNPQDTSYPNEVVETVERETKIPTQAVKMTSKTDQHPPFVYASDYEQPVPVPGGINTAGAEDSPFITPDGNTLYFFFTPDVNVQVEKQILDGVTGIYMAEKVAGEWSKPERIILQDAGKLAGDGCEFVLGDTMWFCSAREGYSGMHWFTAEYKDGRWQNWKISDFATGYQVGELHITGDGTQLYFASDRPGGSGNLDIWLSKKINGNWQEPINVSAVNTADNEGWPALNPGGDELWFTKNFGIWRSKKVNGSWQEAELVISPMAGEPSIDDAGNLYFVHHFYQDDRMVEADIYVAYKR